MHYINRISFLSIKYLLQHFPCVAILGARQVGKTTLLKQIFPESPFFDLEKQADYQRIQADPDFFFSQYSEPIIIDESQILPNIFSALRVAIDNKRAVNGRYLISGSSSPELLRHINESLAGRIAIFHLQGFSLDESWEIMENPLYTYLKEKDFQAITRLKPHITSQQLLKSCLMGAYPEPFLKHQENPDIFQLWMNNYLQSYIQRDVRNVFPGLNIQNYHRFVAMMARASGQILNASEFARSLDISQPTVKFYFQIADGTFVWRMLPSYQKNMTKRLVKMPKGHMRDSGLLNFILKNTNLEELQTHPLFGRIWESFIIEEMIKGFNDRLIPVTSYYYRTGNHAEIDLILEGPFGVLPIEIKSGVTLPERSLTVLKQFVKDHQLSLGVVINNAQEVCWLSEHILQLPAGCL